MSWFGAPVVKIEMEPHPYADNLSIVRITDPLVATVVVNTKDWQGIDRGVYIMPESVVSNEPEFAFLGDKKRIKSVKLRNVYSMGLLVPAREGWEIGQDVLNELGIKKYDDTIDNTNKNKDLQISRSPRGDVKYTDIQNLRKYKHIFDNGEDVVIMEKIHGANARFLCQDNQIFVGSHRQWLKEGNNFWWNAAFKTGLIEVLIKNPDKIFFGEVYGCVQDLHYGFRNGEIDLVFFDIYDMEKGQYLNFSELKRILKSNNLSMAPLLYNGPWLGFEKAAKLAEGQTILDGSGGKLIIPNTPMVREGIVIRPKVERFNDQLGRVILKLKGQGYESRRNISSIIKGEE